MSIVRLRKVFRKRVKVRVGRRDVNLPSWTELVFGVIILIFLVGAFYSFGGRGARDRGDSGSGAFMRTKGSAVIARVNGVKITRAAFDARVRMQLEGAMGEADLTQERWVKSAVLDGMMESVLLRQAADKEKIGVSGDEVNQKKDQTIDDLMKQRFPDQGRLRDFLKKKQMGLDQYKAELRGDLFKDPEALKEQLAQEKLQKQIEDAVQITDQELQDSYTEVQASHILIRPQKEAEKAQAASKGQKVDGDALAKTRADLILQQIKAGADFAKLAKENSADPGSAAKGGDLGFFRRGMMAKEFEDAAFKLQPGQVSEVVKTSFGYHIIKVIGQRSTLPKDFAKNKEMYRTQLKDQRKYKAWQDYRDALKKAATIEVADPELQAYRLADEGKTAEAKPLLQAAVTGDPTNLSAAWELASLAEKDNETQVALDLLNKLAVGEQSARSPQLHLKRGDLCVKLGKKPEALEAYKQAFDWASAFTMPNFGVNMQLEGKVKALGGTALLGQIGAWLADYRKHQASQPNPMGNMIQMPPR
jgi:parvulin-like peptidyl-prolyl isomerase